MNVLAIDTCFGCCTAAAGIGLGLPDQRVVSMAEPMATGHAERIVPMIDEVLREARLNVAALDRIAVANGPGSFTGTRIGVSAARALSLAGGCPVVAFSSLELIAHSPSIAVDDGHDLAVVMSANRGEVYIQRFDGRSREARASPQLLSYDDAATALDKSLPVVAVGSGSGLIIESARARGVEIGVGHPNILASAGDILLRAIQASPLAHPLRPLYLRPPDAKPQDGKSLARVM